jgi:CheY-specific phosphatase CheX
MANIKKIEEILTTAIFEVFEKMFYIFSEPLPGSGGEYHMQAAINFSGPGNGSMQILISHGIAETMVKNMLGLDEDEINEPIVGDCIKESLNMICGNFLRKLDPERLFHLSIPTFEMISENFTESQGRTDHEIHLAFAADEGNMAVIMTAPDVHQIVCM